MNPCAADASAAAIASAVATGSASAVSCIEAALARVRAGNAAVNAITALCADRALAQARVVDERVARGDAPGPLAGVPFVVKANVDVAGVTTTAGSRLLADDAPASADAEAVVRLERQGAVCIGAANMDEFGMGGTTENRHFGPTRNPHDRTRTPGGSSGGCAAALAAGYVPIAIGGDALGSIRLPASLCGIHGLRPTRGTMPTRGVVPATGSITTIGPMARSIRDVATCHAALLGRSGATPGSVGPAGDVASLRVGVARGYFDEEVDEQVAQAVAAARSAFRHAIDVDFPEPRLARAANALVNAAESAGPQIDRLRTRADDFDPLTRDRFLAHALLPAGWYLRAQAFRRWHARCVLEALRASPLMLFPATPCVAPPIGTRTLRVLGIDHPTGPALGTYTQPLAGLDCPVLAVAIARPGRLPVGVQLLAAPGREDLLFAAGEHLERLGIAAAPVAVG